MDNLNYNSVLAGLDIKDTDQIVLVKENPLADSNFISTHLIKQILANSSNRLCLVALHNSLHHYISIGKRLGYDLQKKIDLKLVRVVEPLQSIAADLGSSHMRFIDSDHERIAKYLFKNIENEIAVLNDPADSGRTYLIIDDISCLLDMNVKMQYILPFVNTCVNVENVNSVINCHVASKDDEILAHSLEYIADVVVEVSPLKTGRSVDVTGVFSVTRLNVSESHPNIYHYKTYERGVKTFKPGESLKFL